MKYAVPTHVALLRGINVGGNKKIAMAELRECFQRLGFTAVKTVLNSGNVLFSAERMKSAALAQTIEDGIEAQFGMKVAVIVRSRRGIQTILALQPFAKIPVTENTRLYVTFLAEKRAEARAVQLASATADLQILPGTEREGFSVLTISGPKSIDALHYLDRFFGKRSTTRSWATVGKLARDQ